MAKESIHTTSNTQLTEKSPTLTKSPRAPSPPLGAGERVSGGRERGRMGPVGCRPSHALLSMSRLNRKLIGALVLASVSLAANSLPAVGVVAHGITEPVCDVTLSASVSGIVNAWRFKEGDFVKEGEAIIELDKKLEELEAERRRLVMANRKTDYTAVQTLFEKSSISVKKEELEKAETEYRIAVTEHNMASEQVIRRSVYAPCSGFIVELMRDVGEACQPYQPLIRLVDTRQCYFVSNIEASLAGRLRLDQAVQLEIESTAGAAPLTGKIVFLSPVVDPASGLQKVKVLFDNADGRIRPGVAGKMLF
jgi:RND family efflux transporter MFP subunit